MHPTRNKLKAKPVGEHGRRSSQSDELDSRRLKCYCETHDDASSIPLWRRTLKETRKGTAAIT
ncbi:MAG: hypothetical protein QXK32_02320 [Candidatus Jordarchaeales archaeon]